MDPRPPPENTPENLSPLLENQENEYKEHALVDHESIESDDDEDTKGLKTWEIFKTNVLEYARESRMSPEHILLIERFLPDLFPDLHVPDHPPYAVMIHKAITELDEAGGSTEEAISLFIRKEQNDLPWAHATLLKHHLEKLCQSGDVVVTGEKCYMLNTTWETCQIETFDTNQIVDFNPIQISASPIPYSSPNSSSSGSHSDYTPYAKKRKQKTTGHKYGKKRQGDRKKSESEKEFENNEEEEHSEATEEEEESEEYEDESEELDNPEEEVEVTEGENRLIKYKGKHTHRTEGAKKNKTEDKSEFRGLRVVSVKHQVNGTYNRGTNLVRVRGRPLKCSKPKAYICPKESQMGLIETHNQVAEIPMGLKQKRGRGRPSKNNGFETKTRPEETQEQLWEIHNQPMGISNRPKESRERCSPTKKIGTDTDIGPKEVHEEVINAFNQATKDLNRPREKRGRGRPRKNMGNETNIVQKEAQGEMIEAHNQMDCMEKPKQKTGRGRPPKNSGGQMVVLEVQNQTTEYGMKLKQGRRRFRGKHEREKVDKYLDQLELTVIQEMFEKMKIS